MYSCNDCGEKFETPENDACPHCGSGDYFEETLEDVVNEADEKRNGRRTRHHKRYAYCLCQRDTVS